MPSLSRLKTTTRSLVPHAYGLMIVALMLSLLGLLFVFESSVAESFRTFDDPYFLVKQQAIGFAVGLVACITAWNIPTKWWIKFGPMAYVATGIGLLLVFLPGIGLKLNGASRWLTVGGITLQPVEFFKLGLICYFSHWLSEHQRFGPFLFLTGLPLFLVMLQPDLGSLLLVLSIATGLFILAGGAIKKIALIGAIALPLLILAIVSAPYRLDRVRTFINPELDPLGKSFHVRQITLALGRGGWFGQGVGNSNQRFSYIPEASTDSIFSIVGEEVGFIGSLMIILLFCVFFYLIYKVATHPSLQRPQQLLGLGILTWLSAQTILNLSAVVALVPLTGVPLPFFSYGRSALIMVLLATGIVLRLAREIKSA